MQYQFEKDRVYIEAVTLHAFMMRTCGIEWSSDLSQHFYEKELPATFIVAEDVPAYDLVIIDEGQDLLTDTYLSALTELYGMDWATDHGQFIMIRTRISSIPTLSLMR